MIKVCGDFVAYPITLIFQNSVTVGIFANDWKKVNIVQRRKKILKSVSNYRPVSL